MNNELKELYVTLVEAGLDKEAAILEKYLVKEAKEGKGLFGRLRQKMKDRKETKQELKPALKGMEKGKAFARQVAQEVRKGNIKRVAPGDYMIIHYDRLDRGFFRVLEKFEKENLGKVSVKKEEGGKISRIQIGDSELEKEVQQEQASPTPEPTVEEVTIEETPVQSAPEPEPSAAAPEPEPEQPANEGLARPADSVLGIDPKYAYEIGETDKSFTLVWIEGSEGTPNKRVSVKFTSDSADNYKLAWCKLKHHFSEGRGRIKINASLADAIKDWDTGNVCGNTTQDSDRMETAG